MASEPHKGPEQQTRKSQAVDRILTRAPAVDGCASPMQARRHRLGIATPHLCRARVTTQAPRCVSALHTHARWIDSPLDMSGCIN